MCPGGPVVPSGPSFVAPRSVPAVPRAGAGRRVCVGWNAHKNQNHVEPYFRRRRTKMRSRAGPALAVYAALTLLLAAHQAVVAKEQREAPRPEAADRECIATDAGGSGDGGCEATPSTSVYVIGDIHGDAKCAVSWVNRTGLILNLIDDSKNEDLPIYKRLREPTMWTWADSSSTLVFMGDYVDKGPLSRFVIEFVKSLTDKFPDQVTALLGNHELELLHDRELQPVRRYMSYPYATGT